jgi:hypothetical protein
VGGCSCIHADKKHLCLLQVAEGLFPHFPLQFNYMNIQVQDVPSEDMVIHFPKCFDFIDNAIARGGAQQARAAHMVQECLHLAQPPPAAGMQQLPAAATAAAGALQPATLSCISPHS